jgi:hypothetical protein
MLKCLLTAIVLFFAAQNAVAAKRVALVIANGDYGYLPNLDKVLNDARSLREILVTELGFEVIYGENLNRRDMNRKILEMETRVERDDAVLFYYAGHGTSLGTDNYILPVDLQQPDAGEEKLVMSDSFGVASIARALQAKGARATFVVLDASRNNPFKERAIGPERGLSNMDLPEGVFVLFSAAHGKASLNTLSESDQDPNSVFMRSFLNELKTQDLILPDLAKSTQEKVAASATTTGHEQIPAYQDRLAAPVTLSEGTRSSVAPAEKPPEVKAPENKAPENKVPENKAPSDQATIIEEWKIVEGSKNRAALEGFSAKYGSDPVWGPLVAQALRDLDRKPENTPIPQDATYDEDVENKPLYRDLQTELTRVGCYSGKIDGVWGATSQRALARFGVSQDLTLEPDEDALEQLSEADSEACPETVTREPRKTVTPDKPKTVTAVKPKRPARVTQPRKSVRKARRVVRPRPSVSCWSCKTYSYDTERLCIPSRLGDPSMRVPRFIRCMRG